MTAQPASAVTFLSRAAALLEVFRADTSPVDRPQDGWSTTEDGAAALVAALGVGDELGLLLAHISTSVAEWADAGTTPGEQAGVAGMRLARAQVALGTALGEVASALSALGLDAPGSSFGSRWGLGDEWATERIVVGEMGHGRSSEVAAGAQAVLAAALERREFPRRSGGTPPGASGVDVGAPWPPTTLRVVEGARVMEPCMDAATPDAEPVGGDPTPLDPPHRWTTRDGRWVDLSQEPYPHSP